MTTRAAGPFDVKLTPLANDTTRGEGKLNIIVVPDSGTGELTGLSGTMSIEITNGKHGYVFEYSLAAS